jgi:hypothetical protein
VRAKLEPLAQNVGKTNRLEHGWQTSVTSLHAEEAAEGRRRLSGLATDRAAEVALVCEAEFALAVTEVVSAGDIGNREPFAAQDGAPVQHPPSVQRGPMFKSAGQAA